MWVGRKHFEITLYKLSMEILRVLLVFQMCCKYQSSADSHKVKSNRNNIVCILLSWQLQFNCRV